ncbi:MAG: tRNA (guanosine(46)-N7)-methyltransferase TrmB [Gammaproteobacteria bacterium]
MSRELHRKIRSFVRREGRITRAQQEALARLGDSYIISERDLYDLDDVFRRRAPRVLEIGFGMGDALAVMAQSRPHVDYLGIEVHRPGIGSLLLKLERDAVDNVRIVCADAVEILSHYLPDASLDAVYLYFPDPWPKKRHHKRRIVQPAFASMLWRKLKAGGVFHMATDWDDYAQAMLAVMEATPGYENAAGSGAFSPRPLERPLTKFERRGRGLGHMVRDLVFIRTDQQ